MNNTPPSSRGPCKPARISPFDQMLQRSYLDELRNSLDSPDKEEKLLYTVYFVSNLYYAIRDFLREFHNIGEEE
ncbi:MAG: hypothetical protein ACFFD7_10420 [Candidatus Thorarchaeota archaeon]